ncbi:hypothetical protein P3S68_022419 [Capsicum galapagoense]
MTVNCVVELHLIASGKLKTATSVLFPFIGAEVGICKSVERIKEIHRRCGESKNALWNAVF